MIPQGMTLCASRYGPAETADRLIAAVAAHGMAVMARGDHAAAAAKVGLQLRPTEVLMFGNPRGGTLLMQAEQTIGIDLPLKALIWQDVEGKTWLGYNDPHWIVERHGAAIGGDPIVVTMAQALAALAKAATGADAS